MTKLGRPPLPEAMRRSVLFAVRLTPTERALVEQAATLDGKRFDISGWARNVLVEMAKAVLEEQPQKEGP